MYGVKGLFECHNKECKFRKSFEYIHEKERRKCPICKTPMVQVPKPKMKEE